VAHLSSRADKVLPWRMQLHLCKVCVPASRHSAGHEDKHQPRHHHTTTPPTPPTPPHHHTTTTNYTLTRFQNAVAHAQQDTHDISENSKHFIESIANFDRYWTRNRFRHSVRLTYACKCYISTCGTHMERQYTTDWKPRLGGQVVSSETQASLREWIHKMRW